MHSQRWHWLDDGVLPLALAVMRLCWLWPWLVLLGRWLTPSYQAPFLPVWAVIALFLGSGWVARVTLAQNIPLWQARLWVVISGLGGLLGLLWWQYAHPQYVVWDLQWVGKLSQTLTHWGIEVPPPVITSLTAAGIWLRGVLDGRDKVRHDDIWGGFAFGFIALALLLLVSYLDQAGIPPGTDRWLLLFFAVGMASLALASLELSTVTGRSEPKTPMRLNRYWLASVFSLIVVLIGVGLLVGLLITPATVAQMLGWTSVLLQWLGMVLGYLLLAVAYVLFLVLTPLINWVRRQLAGAAPPEPPQPLDFQKQFGQLQQQPTAHLSPIVVETLRWGGLVGALLLIALAFALALRYFRNRQEEGVLETREIIFSRDLLQQQLASLWRQWLGRLQGATSKTHQPFLSLEGEMENRRLIRVVYQALLAVAKELGYPRLKNQTPGEYQQTLETIVTNEQEPLDTLTAAYGQARYALHLPEASQVEQVHQAWAHLHRMLNAHRQAKNGQNPSPPSRANRAGKLPQ